MYKRQVLDGEVGQTLLDGFNGTGIKAIGFWENGFREVTNNTKEIVNPSDLAGMKIRTMENQMCIRDSYTPFQRQCPAILDRIRAGTGAQGTA